MKTAGNNKLIERDINGLKKIRKLKDRTEYLKQKKIMAAKYNVTLRTIENYLNKLYPGMRKPRDDAGKSRSQITNSEEQMTKELLSSGTKIKQIKKVLMDKTKKKVSTRKLDHIRDNVEVEVKAEIPASAGTSFGDEAKKLFEKLFDLDLIAPNYGLKMTVNGKDFIIPKYYLETMCMILADAYNYVENKYKIDPEQLLRKRLVHLLEQNIRIAETRGLSSKEVETLIGSYEELLDKIKFDADLKVVEKICQDLKAGITFSEIVALIQKYSDKQD